MRRDDGTCEVRRPHPAHATRRDLRLLLALTGFVLAVFFIAVPAWTWGSRDQPQQEQAGAAAEDERLEEFDPSEEVSADSAIAFPVDI